MRSFAKALPLVLALTAGVSASADEAVAPLPATSAETSAVSVTARYASSVLIFRVGAITLSAQMDEAEYSASTFIEAAGLAALFTDFDIRAEVAGAFSETGPQPARYAHVERTGEKVRSVDVSFREPVATADVEPPFGSLGVPPASDADRTGVIDPMTAVFFLSETVAARGGEICSGSIPVFDGKARYDLILQADGHRNVRTRAWRGEALICHIWYRPISGYDPEDYPTEDELRHPLTVWLAPFGDGDVHIPVRLHTRAGFGGVTIEALDIDITGL